jgi:hypothetical protein
MPSTLIKNQLCWWTTKYVAPMFFKSKRCIDQEQYAMIGMHVITMRHGRRTGASPVPTRETFAGERRSNSRPAVLAGRKRGFIVIRSSKKTTYSEIMLNAEMCNSRAAVLLVPAQPAFVE